MSQLIDAVFALFAGGLAGTLLVNMGVRVKTLGATVVAVLSWVMSLLALAAYADAPQQPTWVAWAATCFAVGVFITVRSPASSAP